MPDTPERIGPYHITAKLGLGGMGVVYRADDTRLNRTVALKMLLETGDHGALRDRFLREARAAAAINHPNVCRLYDIGECGGRPFLVMELLEGESLAERLARGAMPLPEAVQVTLSVLSALAALHRAFIVHRDLKPSNVFLSSQGVKLLDFGLAKPFAGGDCPTETELTKPGMIAATPRYASPEQLCGKPVDARSDLFSTAAILLEMLTGRPAFSGNSPLEIFHAILYDSPPSVSGSAAAAAVDRVLHKAFAKAPEDRFHTAGEMAAELRAVLRLDHTAAPVDVRVMKRLIVLPFRALRPDPETDFLAFSLPDAIAASLTGLNSLVVRSSLAAARFSGPAPDLKEIAREADVDVVLTGTLLRAGSQLRLSTQLVEAPAGTLIWSRSMQVELRDIFQLQDTLVSSVVESLQLPLTAGERRQLSHDAPGSASAYDLFLRANELGRDKSSLMSAIELYERAVAIDPGYAPAWARLGHARWLADKYAAGSAAQLAGADAALRRALELNPDLALAHNLYTPVEVEQGRSLDAMRRLLKRAQTSRNDAQLFAGLVHACRYCGLLNASLAAHSQARRLDARIATTVMHTHFLAGDYRNALETSAGDFGYGSALALAMLGRTEEAISVLREKGQPRSWRLGRLFLVSLQALLEGNRQESLQASDELLADTFRDPEGWYYLGRQLSYLSEAGRAFMALSHAVDFGFFCYPALAGDPWLDPLRGRLEFQRILDSARSRHHEAVQALDRENGQALLGVLH